MHLAEFSLAPRVWAASAILTLGAVASCGSSGDKGPQPYRYPAPMGGADTLSYCGSIALEHSPPIDGQRKIVLSPILREPLSSNELRVTGEILEVGDPGKGNTQLKLQFSNDLVPVSRTIPIRDASYVATMSIVSEIPGAPPPPTNSTTEYYNICPNLLIEVSGGEITAQSENWGR